MGFLALSFSICPFRHRMDSLAVTYSSCPWKSASKVLCLCSVPQVLPQNVEKEDALPDREQPLWLGSPATLGPRRSHSLCKDKRSGPFVVSGAGAARMGLARGCWASDSSGNAVVWTVQAGPGARGGPGGTGACPGIWCCRTGCVVGGSRRGGCRWFCLHSSWVSGPMQRGNPRGLAWSRKEHALGSGSSGFESQHCFSSFF